MQKSVSCLLVVVLLIVVLSSCQAEKSADLSQNTQAQGSPSKDNIISSEESGEEAIYAYLKFLSGNSDMRKDEETVCAKYAVCDINNDGISELLISSKNKTYIYSYRNGNLSLWWSDEYWSGYSQILINNSILHIRPGGAPTHTAYHYLVLDENGEEKEHIRFEKYDSDENGIYDYFVFENEDNIFQDEWEQKTLMYLSVKEIEWNEYIDTEF